MPRKLRRPATTAAAIDRNRKTRDALELRKAGVSYSEIAKVLGLGNPGTARRMVSKALTEMGTEPSDEMRMMEMQRLNHILAIIWPKIQKGDLATIDRYLKIQERISSLQGLDAPRQHQLGVLQVDAPVDDEASYIKQLNSVNDDAIDI